MKDDARPPASWDTPPLNSTVFRMGWWGIAVLNLLIALVNPLVYAAMAPTIEGPILTRLLAHITAPVAALTISSLISSRRFFVAGRTTTALAILLISVPACVFLAWGASR